MNKVVHPHLTSSYNGEQLMFVHFLLLVAFYKFLAKESDWMTFLYQDDTNSYNTDITLQILSKSGSRRTGVELNRCFKLMKLPHYF